MKVTNDCNVFCVSNLKMLNQLFYERYKTSIHRLILSNVFTQIEIIEICFLALGKIIPYEISYSLPREDWVAIDDKGNVNYSLI